MYEFIDITENNIKEYKAKFIRLPPQTSRNARVETALDNGIPIEYLVHQNIIRADFLDELNISEEQMNKVIAYMLHIGKIKSIDDIKKAGKEKRKNNEVVKQDKKQKEEIEVEDKSKESLDLSRKFTDEIAKLKCENSKIIADNKDEINKLKAEIERLKNSQVNNTGENTQKVKELENKIARLNDEIDRLKNEVLQKANENIGNLDEIIELKEDNSKLKSEGILKDEKIIALEIQVKALNDARDSDNTSQELQKLNQEISNLNFILNEKIDEINKLKDKNLVLEDEIRTNEIKHIDEIAEIEKVNALKIEEYRVMLSENVSSVSKNKEVTTATTVENESLDVSRARLDGKKIISIVGSRLYDIKSYIDNIDSIEVFDEVEDADLYIVMTDLTKSSIDKFKQSIKDYPESIKVMVNWTEGTPFTADSIAGSRIDLLIKNNPEWYKETWLNPYCIPSWVDDLKSLISNKLGVYF